MIYRAAEFSPDRRYRQRLDRWWSVSGRCGFLLCNPSKADEEHDDQTVIKAMRFAADWGWGGLTIINPWDFVSTSPEALLRETKPSSVRNRIVLRAVSKEVAQLIAAWGCGDVIKAMRQRGFDPFDAIELMTTENPLLQVKCLGMTKDGVPRHPSRLAYSTALEPFDWRAARKA